MTTQPNDSAQQHSSVPARRTPRDIAEHLWDAFPFGDMPWPLREVGRGGGTPMRVEEFRDGGELVVRAELPGVDPEKDVEVTVDEGVLTISAHREERTEEKQADGYRSEFRYGRLERQIRLPKGAGTDDISASYRDGVLEVRLPVPEAVPPARKISIQRG
jgi:HSP20 family protein